jgi:hypothetical protein
LPMSMVMIRTQEDMVQSRTRRLISESKITGWTGIHMDYDCTSKAAIPDAHLIRA